MTNQPRATRFLDRPGGQIAFDDSGGDGLTVVLAPGIGDRRQVYRHLVPELLGAGLRVVTVDLRGMGESSATWDDYSDGAVASDLLALLDAIAVERAVLVGNSLSAAAAVLAATDAPDRIVALTLIGPFVRAVPMSWWKKAAFRALLAPPWGRRAWVSYYRSAMYPGPRPHDHDEYVASVGRMLREPGRMSALRALAANTHAESGARLGQVRQPTLVVMGTADPDFADPAAEAHEVARATGGSVRMIEESGHYPQADQPELVAAAIVELVARVRT